MIGASILIAAGFLVAFIWSVKNDQYADDYTPSVRMLFDDLKDEAETDKTNTTTEKQKITQHYGPGKI